MNPYNNEKPRRTRYYIDWDEDDEDQYVPYDEDDYDMWDEEADYEEM